MVLFTSHATWWTEYTGSNAHKVSINPKRILNIYEKSSFDKLSKFAPSCLLEFNKFKRSITKNGRQFRAIYDSKK